MSEANIIGDIGFGFIEEFARPDSTLFNRLQHAGTADVTDSQNRTGAMDAGIKPLASGKRVFGTVITVDLPPNDNLMVYQAMGIAKPGDVLVVSTNGNDRKAIWGELMTNTAISLKLGGLIVDGLVRDGAANQRYDFPIFCRGTAPVSVEKNGPGFINGEITCGGIVVRPGDIAVGDDDGVVIVKKEHLLTVTEKLKVLEQREKERMAEIAAGQFLPTWLEPTMKKLGLVPGEKRERFLE
jgi:4-hydroxy-4-methyl-2-oxoglutarate aldolase